MYVFSLMQIYEIYNIVENVLDYLQLGCTKKVAVLLRPLIWLRMLEIIIEFSNFSFLTEAVKFPAKSEHKVLL